jgi:hypothetical protein
MEMLQIQEIITINGVANCITGLYKICRYFNSAMYWFNIFGNKEEIIAFRFQIRAYGHDFIKLIYINILVLI